MIRVHQHRTKPYPMWITWQNNFLLIWWRQPVSHTGTYKFTSKVITLLVGSKELSIHEVELSGNNRCQQIEIKFYSDESPLFISTCFLQFEAAERRQPHPAQLMLLQMTGDVHPNQCPATKCPGPVCSRNNTSQWVSYKCNIWSGWVQSKCSGLLNAAQYRIKRDWICDTCSDHLSQQSPPPIPSPLLSPVPSTEQISDDSTFNVLQINPNGIGNKLTELGVVLERNKVNVVVIQESNLSNPRTPASGTTPHCLRTVLKAKEDCWSSFTDR